jgi:hypothetical protein
VCKKQLAAGGKWCQECAHVRGICYICGKQILDTSMYSHHSNALEKQMSKADIAAARPEVVSAMREKGSRRHLSCLPLTTPVAVWATQRQV